MSTHNLCFEQKYENIRDFLAENFQFLEVKISTYLNRHVFVMLTSRSLIWLEIVYHKPSDQYLISGQV